MKGKAEREERKMEREAARSRTREDAFQERVARYQKEKDLRGFFPVRRWIKGRWLWEWAELWTASILVEQARKTGILEFGCMSYVLGEAYFAWKRKPRGEYYPYRVRGEHDHEHDFFSVLAQAVQSDGQVEPETEGGWYAPWMLEYLDRVNRDPALRRRLRRWAEKPWKGRWRLRQVGLSQPVIPCYGGGKDRRCKNEEAVYALSARYWRDFRLEEPERLSPQQKENVAAILEYQRAAWEKQVD